MAQKPTKLELIAAELETLDLAEVQAKIAEIEAERDKAVAVFQNKIDALRIVERFLDVKQNGKPARKKPVRKQRQAATSSGSGSSDGLGENENRRKIHTYLTHAGPTKPALIAAEVRVPIHVVTRLCNNHPSFEFNQINGTYAVKSA